MESRYANIPPNSSRVIPDRSSPPFVSGSHGTGGQYPPSHNRDRLPSVRSIVMGTSLAEATSNAIQLPPPRPVPYQRAIEVLPSPRYYSNSAYGQQSNVWSHGYYDDNRNPSVFNQVHGSFPQENAAYNVYPQHIQVPPPPAVVTTQSTPMDSNMGYRVNTVPMPRLMEPTVNPYYRSPHMHMADTRTPPVQDRYATAGTAPHVPTAGIQNTPRTMMTAGCANLESTGERLGPRNGANEQGLGSSLSQHHGIPHSLPVGASSYPYASMYYQQGGYQYQQLDNAARESQPSTEPNVRYIELGSYGITEAFLSHITARAWMDTENSIRCTECEEEFGNVASWKRHASRSHRKVRTPKVKCPICSIEVKSEGNIKRHLKTVHKSVPDPLVCTHCPAMFSSDRARSIHVMRIHSVQVPVETDLSACGGVPDKQGKRRRAGTQVGKPKMHKCPNCDYMSRWKGNISRHVNAVHLQLRQFPCDICDRRFNTASNLTVHKLTHLRDSDPGTP